MRKLILILSIFTLSIISHNAFASEGSLEKETVSKIISSKECLSKPQAKLILNQTIISLSTICPDGTEMYTGFVVIYTNSDGSIYATNVDYWGESVACAEHQILLFS